MPREKSIEIGHAGAAPGDKSSPLVSNTKQFRPGCVLANSNAAASSSGGGGDAPVSRRVRSHTFSHSNDYSTTSSTSASACGGGVGRRRRERAIMMAAEAAVPRSTNQTSLQSDVAHSHTNTHAQNKKNGVGHNTNNKADLKKLNPMSKKLDKHGGAIAVRNKNYELLDSSRGFYSDYDEEDDIDYYFRTSAAFDYSAVTERNVIQSILEYFDVKNVDEFILAIEQNFDWSPSHAAYLVQTLISLAMQQHRSAFFMDAHRLLRELAARDYLSAHTIEMGFRNLLDDLADLELDVPDAVTLLARFLALAVSQSLVHPDFIQRQRQRVQSGGGSSGVSSEKNESGIGGGVVGSGGDYEERNYEDGTDEKPSESNGGEANLSEKALNRAADLLHINGGGGISNLRRLQWTNYREDGTKPLMEGFELVIKEYLCSLDVAEVEWQLNDIDSPHFHHEFVFQAIMIGLEKNREEARTAVHTLLEALTRSGMLRQAQIQIGVRRLLEQLADLRLDLPNVDALLTLFVEEGVRHKSPPFKYMTAALRDRILDELKTKNGATSAAGGGVGEASRKRFASEGSQFPDQHPPNYCSTESGFVKADDFEDDSD